MLLNRLLNKIFMLTAKEKFDDWINCIYVCNTSKNRKIWAARKCLSILLQIFQNFTEKVRSHQSEGEARWVRFSPVQGLGKVVCRQFYTLQKGCSATWPYDCQVIGSKACAKAFPHPLILKSKSNPYFELIN